MSVRLIALTQGSGELAGKSAEEIVSYAARVSNPKSADDFETAPRLLNYCIKNGHWSIFETAFMTVEIKTSRAISAQIIRHRSFSFQEFSTRYATISSNVVYGARRQDSKNRQNSIDDMSPEDQEWFSHAQNNNWNSSHEFYEEALKRGIAKECARFLLPLSTETTIFMSGNLRSFIHYIDLRSANGTQKEHADIALDIKDIFITNLPLIAKALEWKVTKD